MTLDPGAAKTLLDAGWIQAADSFVWEDDLGSQLRFEAGEDGTRITLLVDDSQVLAFDLRLNAERVPALVAALIENTESLAGLRHASFAKAVAAIASDVVVETTDGALVRPRLENGELRYEPVEG